MDAGLQLLDLALQPDRSPRGLVGAARSVCTCARSIRRAASRPAADTASSNGLAPVIVSSQASRAANAAAESGSASSLAAVRWARTARA